MQSRRMTCSRGAKHSKYLHADGESAGGPKRRRRSTDSGTTADATCVGAMAATTAGGAVGRVAAVPTASASASGRHASAHLDADVGGSSEDSDSDSDSESERRALAGDDDDDEVFVQGALTLEQHPAFSDDAIDDSTDQYGEMVHHHVADTSDRSAQFWGDAIGGHGRSRRRSAVDGVMEQGDASLYTDALAVGGSAGAGAGAGARLGAATSAGDGDALTEDVVIGGVCRPAPTAMSSSDVLRKPYKRPLMGGSSSKAPVDEPSAALKAGTPLDSFIVGFTEYACLWMYVYAFACVCLSMCVRVFV